MSDALFDLEPPALVYVAATAPTDWRLLRCRECHKRGPINGGGVSGGFLHVICQHCWDDRGDVGRRARILYGTTQRERIVIDYQAKKVDQ